MKVNLVNFDNAHYVSSVTYSEGTLQWSSVGNTHQIILRGPFGIDVRFGDAEKAELEKYTKMQFDDPKERCYADGRYITVSKKGTFVNNHTVNVSPATYAVIACSYDDESDTMTVYVPDDNCQYQCKVYAQVKVRMSFVPGKKKKFGFIGRETKPYYIMHIPTIPGYVDGSLKYTYDGCKYQYPITKAMLGQDVSIPMYNGKPPKTNASEKNGYNITVIH